MIAHSIECARQSGLFDRVIVSTDDDEISRVAQRYGAEVPFLRPKELSDDHTGTTEVVAHSVNWLQDQGAKLSAVCCIYATAPFMRQEILGKGWRFWRRATGNMYFHRRRLLFPSFGHFRRMPQASWRCSSLNISNPVRRISLKPCTMPGSFIGDCRKHGSTAQGYLARGQRW